MVHNLKETGTPFDYKHKDFGKLVRKIIAPDHHKAEDTTDESKSLPVIMEGPADIPDYNNRWIEKSFEDSD